MTVHPGQAGTRAWSPFHRQRVRRARWIDISAACTVCRLGLWTVPEVEVTEGVVTQAARLVV